MNVYQLLDQLTVLGGALVSAKRCSEPEILDAMTHGRFAEMDEGQGFIRFTSEHMRKFTALPVSRNQPPPLTLIQDTAFLTLSSLLTETLTLHDTIERMDCSSPWSGCNCDYGCDGRMPRKGPKCKRCLAADRLREIKNLINFDRPEREAKAKSDSLDSAAL